MTVSGRAKVALLRLKTMQRISDDGCFAYLPCHLLSGPCLPKTPLPRRLSTHCHRVLTLISTHVLSQRHRKSKTTTSPTLQYHKIWRHSLTSSSPESVKGGVLCMQLNVAP
jgi:hypothetical protein